MAACRMTVVSPAISGYVHMGGVRGVYGGVCVSARPF